MKSKLLILLLLAFSFLLVNVNAECDYNKKASLNKEASAVKVSYEILTEKKQIDDPEREAIIDMSIDTFKITIFNITSNLRIEKTVDGGEIENISYDQTQNGNYTYYVTDTENIQNHKFQIYSTDGECSNTVLRTIDLVKPKFNEYSNYEICKSAPELSYCSKYTDKNLNLSETEIVKSVEKYKKNTSTEEDNKKETKKENGNYIYYIVGGFILIAIGVVTYIIIQKKRSDF